VAPEKQGDLDKKGIKILSFFIALQALGETKNIFGRLKMIMG
jgi:hypothetical protein